MVEVLEFIFSSFWTWLGTFLIVAAAAQGIGGTINVIRRK